MNMIGLEWKTINERELEIAKRLKEARKAQKISQIDLANKSGVSYGSIKRFEQTGEISLSSLIALAVCLGYASDFDYLFKEIYYVNVLDKVKK